MLENTPYILAMQPRGYPDYPRGGERVTGKVCFSSNPSGAMIYVDGIVLTTPEGTAKRTNTCADLIEGRRDIVFRMKDYQDHGTYVDVHPGITVNKYVNIESERGVVTTPLKLAGLYALARIFMYDFF